MQGMSEESAGAYASRFNTFQFVIDHLNSEGFKSLTMPQMECPGYLDSTVLESRDGAVLAYHFAMYKAWRDFCDQRLAYTKAALMEYKNKVSAIEMGARTELRAQGAKKAVTAQDITDYLMANSLYNQCAAGVQTNTQLKDYYETVHDRLSKGMDLLSRMITLRGQEIESQRRGTNIGAQGAVAGGAGGERW